MRRNIFKSIHLTDQNSKDSLFLDLLLVHFTSLAPAASAPTAAPAGPASTAGGRSQCQGLDGDGLEEHDAADEGEGGGGDGDGAGDEAKRLRPGTNVMVLLIFFQKNLAKKLRFFKTSTNFSKKNFHNIGF
jgi:hypothetical protein